jgi:hypothetical protein
MTGRSALSLGVLLLSQWAAAADPECAARTDRHGPCRVVHGRASLWNGSCVERIWVVGANRMLGVCWPEAKRGEFLPGYLLKHLTEKLFPPANLYGDFLVCPLDAERPGRMQHVCVETWRNLVLEQFTKDGEAVVRKVPSGPAPPWPSSIIGEGTPQRTKPAQAMELRR